MAILGSGSEKRPSTRAGIAALPRLPVSAILSDEVVSAQGQRIGSLKELMVDLHSGAIAYAVLSVGGLFGIGTRMYAVPWCALERGSHFFIMRDALSPSQLLDDLDCDAPTWLPPREQSGISSGEPNSLQEPK